MLYDSAVPAEPEESVGAESVASGAWGGSEEGVPDSSKVGEAVFSSWEAGGRGTPDSMEMWRAGRSMVGSLAEEREEFSP